MFLFFHYVPFMRFRRLQAELFHACEPAARLRACSRPARLRVFARADKFISCCLFSAS